MKKLLVISSLALFLSLGSTTRDAKAFTLIELVGVTNVSLQFSVALEGYFCSGGVNTSYLELAGSLDLLAAYRILLSGGTMADAENFLISRLDGRCIALGGHPSERKGCSATKSCPQGRVWAEFDPTNPEASKGNCGVGNDGSDSGF